MRSLLFTTALACAALGGCAKDKSEPAATKKDKAEFPEITVEELAKGLAAKQIVAVDCNGDKTRKKFGIIPGAILVTDEAAIGASELPADKATKLVFYCSGPG